MGKTGEFWDGAKMEGFRAGRFRGGGFLLCSRTGFWTTAILYPTLHFGNKGMDDRQGVHMGD